MVCAVHLFFFFNISVWVTEAGRLACDLGHVCIPAGLGGGHGYLRFLQAKLPSGFELLVTFACSQICLFAGICDFNLDFLTALVTLVTSRLAPLQEELSFKVIEMTLETAVILLWWLFTRR